jgi:hypothetical protein
VGAGSTAGDGGPGGVGSAGPAPPASVRAGVVVAGSGAGVVPPSGAGSVTVGVAVSGSVAVACAPAVVARAPTRRSTTTNANSTRATQAAQDSCWLPTRDTVVLRYKTLPSGKGPRPPEGRLTSRAILPASARRYLNLSAEERASCRCIVARSGHRRQAAGLPPSTRGAGRPRTRAADREPDRDAPLCRGFRRNRPWHGHTQQPRAEICRDDAAGDWPRAGRRTDVGAGVRAYRRAPWSDPRRSSTRRVGARVPQSISSSPVRLRGQHPTRRTR